MGPGTIGKGIVRRTIAKDDASSNTVTVLPTLIAHAAGNPRVYAKIKFPDGGWKDSGPFPMDKSGAPSIWRSRFLSQHHITISQRSYSAFVNGVTFDARRSGIPRFSQLVGVHDCSHLTARWNDRSLYREKVERWRRSWCMCQWVAGWRDSTHVYMVVEELKRIDQMYFWRATCSDICSFRKIEDAAGRSYNQIAHVRTSIDRKCGIEP